jgi:hypothetical protein
MPALHVDTQSSILRAFKQLMYDQECRKVPEIDETNRRGDYESMQNEPWNENTEDRWLFQFFRGLVIRRRPQLFPFQMD